MLERRSRQTDECAILAGGLNCATRYCVFQCEQGRYGIRTAQQYSAQKEGWQSLSRLAKLKKLRHIWKLIARTGGGCSSLTSAVSMRSGGPFTYAVHSNAKRSVSTTYRTGDRATNRDKQRVTKVRNNGGQKALTIPSPTTLRPRVWGAVTGCKSRAALWILSYNAISRCTHSSRRDFTSCS